MNKSDREKELSYDLTHLWNLRNKQARKTQQKQTHRYREKNRWLPEGRGMGKLMKYFSRSLTCGMKLGSLFFPDCIGSYIRILISVQFSCSVMSNSLRPQGLQHAKPLCPSTTPRVYSNSCPLSWWCHPTISSSVVPFSSYLQSFPASGSFSMSQFFASGGQVLVFQLQHQSFQWIFRPNFL